LLIDFNFNFVESLHVSSGNLEEINFDTIPNNINKIIIENNKLKTLNYIPNHIKYLDLTNNLIEYIDLSNLQLETLILNNNKLNNLNNLPITLKHLYCSYNEFDILPNISYLENLRVFECSYNKRNLEFIHISNKLDKLSLNFSNINYLSFGNNADISNIEIAGNKIKTLKITENTKELICTGNKNILVTLNNKLIKLHISGCDLTSLPVLPNSLLELRASANLLDSLESLPRPDKKIKVILYSNPIEKVYDEYCNSIIKD
jgi:hypothetical protein